MKRRIVQHGSSSLTVTLPSKWVKKLNLKKGDEVNVEESADRVVITAKKRALSEVKVIGEEFGRFTKNNLSHLYIDGYDEIKIRYSDEKVLEEIKQAIPECIGFEIIGQKEGVVHIKSIANALESDFDILLRKVFQVTNDMAKECYEAIKKKDFKKLDEIRHLESINNKFSLFCARILTKHGYKKQERSLQMYELVKSLEKICDRYKYICDLLRDYDKGISKNVLEFFKEVNGYFDSFYEMFYKFNPDLKERVYEKKKIMQKGENLIEKAKDKEVRLLYYLIDILGLSYDCAGAYFALES